MSNSDYEILFHIDDVELALDQEPKLKSWILSTIERESKVPGNLNFIFCSDEYLHKMNVTYLNHDTLTDVITFPLRSDRIEGDIFISVERVTENATSFNEDFATELRRVIIHGVLHLIGYADKTEKDIEIMRAKEAHYLSEF